MHCPRRREFLSSLGAFALLPTARTEAERVLYNGNILTMDPSQPRAQAVAISDGRFLAVGRDADVLNGGSSPARTSMPCPWPIPCSSAIAAATPST